jgi:hypothetical protein
MATQPNDKQVLNSILVGLTLMIILDFLALTYTETLSPSMHLIFKKLNVLSKNFGELLRLFFVFVYGIIMWTAYKNKLVLRSSLNTPTARSSFAFLSLLLIVIFTLLGDISVKLLVYLYPIVFISMCVSIILLAATFNEVINDEEGSKLGVENAATEKELGIALPVHGGYINIPNIFRSVLGIGGSGAGKSASVAEPILYKVIEKGFSGFLYDFKFPTLANVSFSCFKHQKISNVKFYCISFTDLSRSHRFNPIDPNLLTSSTYAEEYAYALYCNLDTAHIKKPNFFSDSGVVLLKAVIWFMKKHHPKYCTLPHVTNVILNADTKTIVKMLASDIETRGMVKSVAEADEKGASDQLAGVTGSITKELQKINTPEIAWVLTGDDFTLDINNPIDSKFVIFGSMPELKKALNPVIAFSETIALKLMNAQGKNPSIALIDEAPTKFLPDLEVIPATGRSNKLALVYLAQDFSQIDDMVGEQKRRALVGNLATQFYGATSELQTAKHVSEMLGEEYRTIASTSSGVSSSQSGDSSNKGVNYSKQKRKIIEAASIQTLKQGTFVGKMVESKNDWFMAKMKRIQDFDPTYNLTEIPQFVENFILDKSEIERSKLKANEVIENRTAYLRDKEFNYAFNVYDKEILGITNALNSKEISDRKAKELRGKAETELRTYIQKITYSHEEKRKAKEVLDNYFIKIQNEVESILTLYRI